MTTLLIEFEKNLIDETKLEKTQLEQLNKLKDFVNKFPKQHKETKDFTTCNNIVVEEETVSLKTEIYQKNNRLVFYSDKFPKELEAVNTYEQFDINNVENWSKLVSEFGGKVKRVMVACSIMKYLKWDKDVLLLLTKLLTTDGVILFDMSFMENVEWFRATDEQKEELKNRYNLSEPEKLLVDEENKLSKMYSLATFKDDMLGTKLYIDYEPSNMTDDATNIVFPTKDQITAHNVRVFEKCGFEVGSDIKKEYNTKYETNKDKVTREKLITNSQIVDTYDNYPMVNCFGYPVRVFMLSLKNKD